MKIERHECDSCKKILYDSERNSPCVYIPPKGIRLVIHSMMEYYFCNFKCLKEWVNKEEDEA